MTRPNPQEQIGRGTGFLHRGDLIALGLTRRAVDRIFERLPIVSLPGFNRPMVKVEDYVRLVEDSTYRPDEPRVRTVARR